MTTMQQSPLQQSPRIPRVLSIAGTDPTGGAGLHADLKSILMAGGYAMGVVTALVAQNTQGVRAIHTPGADFLRQQFLSVSDDVTIDAIKIGMLGDKETIHTVHQLLAQHTVPIIVIDPVMVSTSGHRLLEECAEHALYELIADLPHLISPGGMGIITPNTEELSILAHRRAPIAGNNRENAYKRPASIEEAIHVSQDFARSHTVIVTVKSGHVHGNDAGNYWVDPNPESTPIHAPAKRIATVHTHGTGCSFSAALATRLAAGDTPQAALAWATDWLHEAIAHASELHVGHGHGPIHHSYRINAANRSKES